MFKEKAPFLLLLLTILIVQLITLWPSFNLALFGDDWLTFWRYSRILDFDPALGVDQGYTHLSYFFTPYGPQDIVTGVIQKIFGYNALPFYTTSFVFRLIAALSVGYAYYKLAKNKISAFMVSAFVAISNIGLETTNWVFNMTSYLAIVFVSFFLLFFFKSREKGKKWLILIAYFFSIISMTLASIRMHGIIPLIGFAEITWFLVSKDKKKTFYHIVIRLVMFVFTIYLINKIGTSFGNPAESVQRVLNGYISARDMIIKEKTLEVLVYPLTILGNMIFPDALWIGLRKFITNPILGKTRPFPVLSLVLYPSYLFAASKFSLNGKISGKKKFAVFALGGLFFTFIVWLLYKNSEIAFRSINILGATLIGGYFMIFMSLLVFLKILKGKRRSLFLTIIFWPFAFIALPWFTSPFTIFPTTHRYLVVAGIGVIMSFGLLLLINRTRKFTLIGFVILVLFHISATNTYLKTKAQRRGVEVSDKVWEVLHASLPEYKKGEYYVVYFEGDNKSNGDVVHNNAFFGFPPRIGLENNIYDLDDIPVGITTYEALEDMVLRGGSLKEHAKKSEKLPLDRVYAFRILGDSPDTIIVEDIREETIEKLRQQLKENEIK